MNSGVPVIKTTDTRNMKRGTEIPPESNQATALGLLALDSLSPNICFMSRYTHSHTITPRDSHMIVRLKGIGKYLIYGNLNENIWKNSFQKTCSIDRL